MNNFIPENPVIIDHGQGIYTMFFHLSKTLVTQGQQVIKGDIVIAKVTNAKPTMIIAEVIHVAGKNRSISSDTDATIHVEEIAQGFIKDASTEYKTEDYVRAKVIQVKPSVQLQTKDRNLGAIKALCSKCRHPLVKKSHGLECENCGNKDHRRIADDYGNLDMQNL